MDLKNQTQTRQIKFRAWDKTYSLMNYKVQVGNTDHADPNYTCNSIWVDSGDFKTIGWMNADDKCIDLMQFTGLKDKNGKEIYEGDILRNETFLVNLETNQKVVDSDFVDYYEVFFNSETGYNSFALKCVKTTRKNNFGLADINKCFINNYTQKSEVIGNIFENPELLQP
jgi:uncharacterized phage protein (TIGR01671 family)